MVLEHLEVLEYIGELVDLVDGRPDAVVAAVAGRDPSLKYSRVFLTDLRKKRKFLGSAIRLMGYLSSCAQG